MASVQADPDPAGPWQPAEIEPVPARQRVFLTGATGSMGFAALNELLKAGDRFDIVILARPSPKNEALLAPYHGLAGLTIHWGDLTRYEDVRACVSSADIVLHVGALVSPEADYHPELTMKTNYGSTMHIIRAIKAEQRESEVRLVYIGTVAETGDRMPPIHWGRVGDPLKPSVFDNYAVSKIAAERAVIESGIRRWVSLRQTGILSAKMAEIEDAIMFHNCLDNVLEYVTDRDSAVLLRHACGDLPDDFWGHVYNIGGGPGCRISCHDLFRELFGRLGIRDLSCALEANWFAIRNFHGQYYLDSDRLESYLHFRHDTLEYFYEAYLRRLGRTADLSCTLCWLPGGQRLIGSAMKRRFRKLARAGLGTLNFIENNHEDRIAAYFISREEWKRIPPFAEFRHFRDWGTVIRIDHGYDEQKPEAALTLADVQGAARFRGGACTSPAMTTGDWRTPLAFTCAFGHAFTGSPRLILEAGHWCPVCERESWNYHEIAKVSPFFAQVWYPLHDRNEPSRVYPKTVSELDVDLDT